MNPLIRTLLLTAIVAAMLAGPIASASPGHAAPAASLLAPAKPNTDPVPGVTSPFMNDKEAHVMPFFDERGTPTAEQGGDYALSFRCPRLTEGNTVGPLGCPYYILDEHDIMSSPILVVDPKNPDYIAFNALHGGRGVHPIQDSQPPSDRSRDNSVHQPGTTFLSPVGGRKPWTDNPYYAPASLENRDAGRQIFGEDNAIVLDAEGRLYVANIYAYRDSGSESQPFPTGPFKYAIALWKFDRVNRAPNYFENVKILYTNSIGQAKGDGANKADSLHLVYDRQANRVVIMWRETVAQGATSAAAGGKSSFVQAYWTNPSEGAMWTKIPEDQRVGPCSAISNPLAYQGRIYFGCYPAQGYTYYPANASEDARNNLQIHALRTADWSTEYVSGTPVTKGYARLAPRLDGKMYIVASGVDGNKVPYVDVTYGELGARWSSPEDFASRLTNKSSTREIIEARVTATAFRQSSGNIHFVYMERYKADQGQPEGAPGQGRDYYKSFGSARPHGEWKGKFDLKIGQLTGVDTSFALTGYGTGTFNDLHDGLAVWRDPKTGEEFEFVAFADYGLVRFALVEEFEPNPPIFVPGVEAVVVPLATAGTNLSTYGAAAGLLAGAMVLRLLMAKKKVAAEAPSL